MTVQGIRCNICTAPMPERLTRQVSVPLEPQTLANGHIRKVVVQFYAGGAEYAPLKVPNYDTLGKRLEDTIVEQEVIKATDFDICLKCMVLGVKEALKNYEA